MVEQSEAQLVCFADGVPQPTLTWEKDGNPLTEGTGEYTILPSGELVIDVAQVRNSLLLLFRSLSCIPQQTAAQDYGETKWD